MRLKLAFVPLFVVACTPFQGDGSGLDDYTLPQVEEAFPGARITGQGTAQIEGADGEILSIPYVVKNGLAVTGGDIILGEAESFNQRSAGIHGSANVWDTCEIPYSFDASLTSAARSDFLRAVEHWEAVTPLRFREDAGARARIRVRDGAGCSSLVGHQGNAQPITLSSNCGRGAAIHEIGHALGLFHEQSRADADQHVIKHWDNIQSRHQHNFNSYRTGEDRGMYDFGSIMHYGSWAFATGTCYPGDTSGCSITHLDGSYIREWQRDHLSSGDLAGIDALYGARCGSAGGSTGGGVPDDHGNTADTGTPVSRNSTTNGTLDPADDDYFQVSVNPGDTVVITSTSSIDTYGYVELNGTVIASDDDSGAGNNFRVEFVAQRSTYDVRVRGYNNATTGAYRLEVSSTAPPDDHGSDFATATGVTVSGSSSIAGGLDAGDYDYLRLEVQRAGALSAFTESAIDTYGTLYDAAGTVIDQDDDTGNNYNFAVTADVQPGTYFLQIRGYSDTVVGPYTVQLSLQ